MSFNFSKSRFVAACTRCNKYAWLDKNKQKEKAKPSEFTESLFDNGHKVGELAKQYFSIDVDVTILNENGAPNNVAMIDETKKQLVAGKKIIAEASFSYGGFFCSVDILVKNDDGSYNIYEVKSSKRDLENETKYDGVKEKYVIDAAYQQYVLENCGLTINKVFVVLLSDTYVREKDLELDNYFIQCPVTKYTTALQNEVRDKLLEIGAVLSSLTEPTTVFTKNCKDCDCFNYCSSAISKPSIFDLYDIKFSELCEIHNDGISFFDIPGIEKKLNEISSRTKTKRKEPRKLGLATRNQIEYYNRPNDVYIDKTEIKKFLDSLKFPLCSLDFETYQAIVPEYEGMKTSEAIPFQYSLHIMKTPNGDYREGSPDLEEKHFIDISGGDPRRAIAESLVKDIPYGACIIAYHESTERNIIKRLAELFPDLSAHLLSFGYKNAKGEDRYLDPQPLFQKGYYYSSKMGNSFSLKSILPALYPDDTEMDYHNLEGSVKNGTQAMAAIAKAQEGTEEERKQIEKDLIQYCELDTFAVVKIIKKLYEVI
jgi:hypothetical protein